MEEVQGWVFTICAGALICGIVSALVPGKTYEKSIQLLLGLFMLCCFLTPVAVQWELPQVDLDAAEEQRQQIAKETEGLLNDQIAEELPQKFLKAAAPVLAEYGIEVGEAKIRVMEDDSGSPVAEVTVPGRLRERGEALTRRLSDSFGVPVRLTFAAE